MGPVERGSGLGTPLNRATTVTPAAGLGRRRHRRRASAFLHQDDHRRQEAVQGDRRAVLIDHLEGRGRARPVGSVGSVGTTQGPTRRPGLSPGTGGSGSATSRRETRQRGEYGDRPGPAGVSGVACVVLSARWAAQLPPERLGLGLERGRVVRDDDPTPLRGNPGSPPPDSGWRSGARPGFPVPSWHS